jgi:hypothetical protein
MATDLLTVWGKVLEHGTDQDICDTEQLLIEAGLAAECPVCEHVRLLPLDGECAYCEIEQTFPTIR